MWYLGHNLCLPDLPEAGHRVSISWTLKSSWLSNWGDRLAVCIKIYIDNTGHSHNSSIDVPVLIQGETWSKCLLFPSWFSLFASSAYNDIGCFRGYLALHLFCLQVCLFLFSITYQMHRFYKQNFNGPIISAYFTFHLPWGIEEDLSYLVVCRLLLLRSTASRVHGLSTCGTQAYLPWGKWHLPRSGIEPMAPALAGRFFFFFWQADS